MNSERDEAEVHRRLHRALYQLLLSLDIEHQNYVLSVVRSWSKVSPLGASLPRAMSADELLLLADSRSIELGAHTRHHPMLPHLSSKRQREEIQASKKELEALVGRKITGFSYPNGKATTESKRLVRELGFVYACTSLHDVVRPGSDIYNLTRFWQKDGDRFLRGLESWM